MVHSFCYFRKGEPLYFLWDIESGSLYNVDYVAFLCARNRYGKFDSEAERSAFSALSAEETKETEAEFDQLEKEGALNAKPLIDKFSKRVSAVKAMCLHICHDCNLRCGYCFASGGTYNTARDYMSAEVGEKAVDFLIKNSGEIKNLEVDYFGGEPLMNLDVVKRITEYAKDEAAKAGKRFSFTMTTNCLLLNEETAAWLNGEMDNVVLSIDGRESVHNAVRHTVSGRNAYPLILKNALNFRRIRGAAKSYVRGTFTKNNLDFTEDVKALNDLGFDQISMEPVVLDENDALAITASDAETVKKEYERLAEEYLDRRAGGKWFNFFHYMIDLDHGPCIHKRLTGCGAGTEYLAVSPTGDIYPCHQFVGNSEYYIGNVYDGILHPEIRERFSGYTVLKKEHCADCPAKYYCGGGCAANALKFSGRPDGRYELGCELQKKRMEMSLAVAYIERAGSDKTRH